MSDTPILYCKRQVIANTRIKPSDWHKYRNNGIIPPPIGREGNEHRWSSSVINAISEQMLHLGNSYSREDTVDILLEELRAVAEIIQSN